ncbi:MAG TPA: hypothetical protein PK129_09710, partial [Cellvibrionaceae bacterium]|nr:hypothetical protein [Cellvibrionaceae bacterium]
AYATTGDLRSVAVLLEGARATGRVVMRNLGFSLIYNVVFASLALGGAITPLLAAILMPISSLTVIGSSLVGGGFRGPAHANSLPSGADAPQSFQLAAAPPCSK